MDKAIGGNSTPVRFANYLRSRWELARQVTRVRSFPYKALVEITNRCGLACPLCPTGHGLTIPKGDMTVEQFETIIGKIGKYLYHVDLFNWGDPLRHPGLFDIIGVLKNWRIHSNVSTHLSYEDDDLIRRLAAEGPDSLYVSMDGATQEVYQIYRRGGDLGKVTHNLRLLLDERIRRGLRKPEVAIGLHVSRYNEGQLDEFRELGARLGVDQVAISPIRVDPEDDHMFHKWLPQDEKLSCYDYSTRRHRELKPGKCDWPWTTIAVDWNGDIRPCCYWFPEEHIWGNILRQSLAEIWHGDTFAEARHGIRDGAGGNTVCHTCRGVPRDTSESVLREAREQKRRRA